MPNKTSYITFNIAIMTKTITTSTIKIAPKYLFSFCFCFFTDDSIETHNDNKVITDKNC